jgi:hypothetical protein
VTLPAAFILDPEVPGAPRTETACYGMGRAPFASALPDLPMTPDQKSDLVHNALARGDDFAALLDRRLHVRSILEGYAVLELERDTAVANLEIAQRLAAEFERALTDVTQRWQDELAVTKRLLDRTADDSIQLAKLHRYADAERTTSEAWQHHCAELMVANAKLKAQVAELTETSIGRLVEIARLQERGAAPDKVVVDPIEWASDPTPTGRDSATMAEIVGGRR